ncbi:MAG: chemotaxis protein CheA [Rickettsiales bacterium]|nr:chemotaxis protein CheA [Rickettsiales bacterium]
MPLMVSLDQFRQTYVTECFELLADMEQRLLGLGESGANTDELNAIFRCAHSIKGGAGAFGFDRVTHFTHILETLLDAMREERVEASHAAIEALLRSVDVVTALVRSANEGTELEADFGLELEVELKALAGMEGGQSTKVATLAKSVSGMDEKRFEIHFSPHENLFITGNDPLLLLRELATLGSLEIYPDMSALPPLEHLVPDHAYLRWKMLLTTQKDQAVIAEVFEFVEDECDLKINELIVENHADSQEKIEHKASGKSGATKEASGNASAAVSSIRVDLEKVDRLVNMVGELVITQAMLQAQTRDLPIDRFPDLLRGVDELAQHPRELQEAVMAVRMQPIKSIFSRMPRIVHDIASQMDKDIRLLTTGEDTEVDKTIIEQLADPLTHMIRNAADHGVEHRQKRIETGKNAQGTIRLHAYHQGGKIVLEISDDGAGLNRERILQKAREKGLVAADASLSDDEIDQLIFLPGFSTAEKVSNISGRGVGMDVVKRNIASMGGTVHLRSRPGLGSTFTVFLPLTLAILDGMIVRVGAEFYIIPITSIIETLRPKAGEVRAVPGDHDVMNIRGEFVPVLYLHRLFAVRGAERDPSRALIVLIESGQEKLGLVVDELVGQQQVVIKSLEANADPMPGISGATILGDGKVSLILDVAGLKAIHTPHLEEQVDEQAA